MAITLPSYIPKRIADLPRDERGYPVPFFVWTNPDTGKPDFRVMDPKAPAACYMKKLCWICGQPLHEGELRTFVIGPMGAMNLVHSEPPSHLGCAEFAAKACPFLTTPRAKYIDEAHYDPYRESLGLPLQKPPGHVKLNPGVCILWSVDRHYKLFNAGARGTLIRLPHARCVTWYAEGRLATRDEALAGLDKSFRAGKAACVNEMQLNELMAGRRRLMLYLPAAGKD